LSLNTGRENWPVWRRELNVSNGLGGDSCSGAPKTAPEVRRSVHFWHRSPVVTDCNSFSSPEECSE